ncbi:hypothetical protein Agub_g7763 [Astrephomene gubernaculifera]|uniref:Sulfotransferase n=1 Tax=Astrephomene gubernaculifera TaxID=47775 RepID=A0AAD3HMX7_9CHLO|nr:hypothetical protein Agub_g7763 [Astrephomene gubernaculifera]
MITHPQVKWVGGSKEVFWFNGPLPHTTLCDAHVEDYQARVAMQRQQHREQQKQGQQQELTRHDSQLRAEYDKLLVGDWSTTYLSCLCCPLSLKTLNPKMKLIAVLRDPVQRAVSRFLEQQRSRHLPFHKLVANHTFASFVASSLADLRACLARAAPLSLAAAPAAAAAGPGALGSSLTGSQQQQQQAGGAQERASDPAAALQAAGAAAEAAGVFRGWGAGWGLGRWMEAQCFARNNILGYSAYDIFLENYLAHFPRQQLLVLYTEDLAHRPTATFRSLEAHLGLPAWQYDSGLTALAYNTRECYGWKCSRKNGTLRSHYDLTRQGAASTAAGGSSSANSRSISSSLDDHHTGNAGTREDSGSGSSSTSRATAEFNHAVSQLVAFYRPHVQRLLRWADAGVIAQPPEAWRTTYRTRTEEEEEEEYYAEGDVSGNYGSGG